MTQKNEDNRPTPQEVPTEKHDQGHKLTDPKPQQQQGSPSNEGEGNRTAARAYNKHAQQSAANPDEVRRDAEAARRALESDEGRELKDAEKAGRKPARR